MICDITEPTSSRASCCQFVVSPRDPKVIRVDIVWPHEAEDIVWVRDPETGGLELSDTVWTAHHEAVRRIRDEGALDAAVFFPETGPAQFLVKAHRE